jgi:hypothetical protein
MHYENWTKPNPPNWNQWKEWEEEYKPINNIQDCWYKNISDPITLKELEETIKKSPTSKATGPHGISNEMLKHLGSTGLTQLCTILNACLILNTIPKTWKHSNIYPISKKPKFTGQLNNTRPITLIEHTRKILTKIITNRLNNILTRYPILNNSNHVALPNTSTAIPISTLTHIIESANASKQELWLLSQDMSKAYDSVHIPLLCKALQRIKIPKNIIDLIRNIFTD